MMRDSMQMFEEVGSFAGKRAGRLRGGDCSDHHRADHGEKREEYRRRRDDDDRSERCLV
ncbi:MAG: hypothetical protein WKF30_02065 [Pyrinomonadaceae bacterium]